MTRVKKSVLIFGIYSMIMGVVLLCFSKTILPVFNLPISNEPWIYLLGFVLCCSSYYYIRSAFHNNNSFAEYTIHTRAFAPVIVAILIISGKADWHFLTFGIVDGLGGFWTWLEIKREKNKIKQD